MIFTEPCCEELRLALTCGQADYAFEQINGDGPLTILAYSVWGSVQRDDGTAKPSKGQVAYDVLFCPFCGVPLQTREAIAEWHARQKRH